MILKTVIHPIHFKTMVVRLASNRFIEKKQNKIKMNCFFAAAKSLAHVFVFFSFLLKCTFNDKEIF